MHQNQIRNEALRVLRAEGWNVGPKILARVIKLKDQGHSVESILFTIKQEFKK